MHKVAFGFVTVVLTYLVAYSMGVNSGIDVAIKYDPRCKQPVDIVVPIK